MPSLPIMEDYLEKLYKSLAFLPLVFLPLKIMVKFKFLNFELAIPKEK